MKLWLENLWKLRTAIINRPMRLQVIICRGGVEDARLEAKAKDTKKLRGQVQPFRGQTLSRPRTKDTSASASQKNKKVFTKIFQAISKKKKVFTNIFQAISTKKRFPKNFSSALQNFNNSKNSAVLEPRTGQFLRTRGQGQGLQNVSSRPRTSSRTPPLIICHKKVILSSLFLL